jgi:putative peptidoglycan lipid II flippase
MVGWATSFAVLPTLSRFGAGIEENVESYREALLFGMKLILLLMLPILGGALVLAGPVVSVLFEHGAFRQADSALTRDILLAFSPQLPFTAIDYLLILAFYARQDTRTPVLVGVASVLIYLAVALTLIAPLGIVGLALADAAKNSGHGLILLGLLRRRVPGLQVLLGLGPFLGRTLPAAALMAILLWLGWHVLAPLGDLVGLAVLVPLGALCYALLLHWWGVPEARAVVALASSGSRLARRSDSSTAP